MAKRQSKSGRMVKNAKGEMVLVWFDFEPDMFDPATAKLINTARTARQTAAAATEAADKAIAGKKLKTAEGADIVLPGEVLIVSHRFGKLTVASAEPEGKPVGKNRGTVA